MPRTPKTVLITGSQGFTGRYAQAELRSAGYCVVGLGSNPSTEANYRQVDLSDLALLAQVMREVQPDLVVHLAGIAFVGHGDANAFYQVNLLGTRNLLEAITQMGKTPDCVLLASSANIYGNTSEGMLHETTLPAPANDYAVSKLAMEYMASLYRHKLPMVIARPFNYTGVGQAEDFLIPKIVAHFRTKAPVIELGNLDVWRDFGDVRTVAQTYRALLEAPAALGQTINVCTGQAHSLREVIDLCTQITGHSIQVRVNPSFVRANEVKTLCGDATRLQSVTGRQAFPPLQDTLRWMLSSQ